MNYKALLTPLLTDIRFWIVLFFLIHLCTITLPPLEPGSTWRQTDGLMIARNFYERNANIFYPTVDVAGEKSGIVGCEFPLLNYLINLVSLIFGYQSWYGRLINLIISSFGVFFFYRLIKKYFNEAVAFNSGVIVLVSIWFTYNRTNLPDTFALSLCIISLYCGINYLEKGAVKHLLFFFIFGLFGCLSKISAASILTVLAIPFLSKAWPQKPKILLFLFSALILAVVCSWYFFWVPYLNTNFGLSGHFFMGMSFTDGIKLLLSDLPLTLKRFYDTPFKYIGFGLFLTGLYFVIKKKQWLHLAVFLIPFITYLIIVLKIAVGLHVDAYYVIMFIPPMAFIMGWGLTQFDKKIITIVTLLAIGIEGTGNQAHVFKIRPPFTALNQLESVLDQVSARTDLIVINGTSAEDPTPMYMAHRRGWVTTTESLSDSAYIQNIKRKGCKYIVLVKQVYGDSHLNFPIVHDSGQFKVYDLRQLVTKQ